MDWQVGRGFRHRFVVDRPVYEGFLATFGDRNPLHCDAAFARAKGFADVVMHGNVLNGFVSYFVGELLPTDDVIIHKQEIRFRKPVYLGDELDFTATVTAWSEAVRAIEFEFGFVNQRGERVATGKLQVGLL